MIVNDFSFAPASTGLYWPEKLIRVALTPVIGTT
jgi:hypothetical protein